MEKYCVIALRILVPSLMLLLVVGVLVSCGDWISVAVHSVGQLSPNISHIL